MNRFRISEETFNKIVLIVYSMFIFSTSITMVSYFSLHSDSYISLFMKLIRFISYAGCLLISGYNIMHKKYSLNILIVYGIVFIPFFIYFVLFGNPILVKPFLLFLIVYGIKDNKIVFNSLIIQMVILFVTVVLAKLGLIDNYITPNRNRDFLGFAYASFASYYFLFTFLLFINVRRDKLSYIELLVIFVLNYFFYMKTDTKFPFYIVIFTLILLLINKNIKLQFNSTLVRLLPVVLICLILCLCLVEHTDFIARLNQIVSNRIVLSRQALHEYGVSLFGQDVNFVGFDISNMDPEGYNYVDSSYIQILIKYGIASLLSILFVYDGLVCKGIKECNNYLIISVITIFLVAIFDPYLYDILFNVFPVLSFSSYCAFEDNKVINSISNFIRNRFKIINRIFK